MYRKIILPLLLLTATLLQAQTPDANHIVYVKETASGTGDGSSWDDATSDLQGAINAPGATKVFVATGKYNVPAPNSFVMKNNVGIYGGFDPGKGIKTLSDARIFPTFDGKGSVLNGMGAHPVIWSQQQYNEPKVAFVLDGFTITGGWAQNGSRIGNAIHLRYTVPVLTNLIIKNNHGGMSSLYIESSSSASTKIQNIAIVDNTFDNTDIHNANSAVAVLGDVKKYTFENMTVVNNIVHSGTYDRYNAFYNGAGDITIRNSIVLGSVYEMPDHYISDHSMIPPQYGYNHGGSNESNGDIYLPPNITIEQIFTNPSAGDYTLKKGSPAIDVGSNVLFAGLSASSTDLYGNPRVRNYATGGIIDLGACESPYVMVPPAPDANGIIYVKESISGDGSGNSWDNALGNLATAIHTPGVQKVFVAVGNYDVGSASFIMKNNVAVYGGFDPEHNIKTLTDNRIMPDPASASQGSVLNGQGARPVIWNVFNASTAMDNTAVLDGFTITNGKSGGNGTGGGIYNEYASPTLANLVISNNKAQFGGGIYNKNSSPKLEHISIIGNSVQWDGGGIYNKSSAPSMVNITIRNNKANYGGGVFNQTAPAPSMVNVLITGNSSNNDAGGMYNDAGAIPVLTNTTITGNKAPNEGEAIYNRNASVSLNNSIIYGSISGAAYTAQYSLVAGGSGNHNLNADNIASSDVFTDASNGIYTLRSGSPAIGAGSNSLFSGLTSGSKDLEGNTRLLGSAIDMGAYEYQDGALPVTFGAFSAVLKDGRLLVSWTTETETGNDHFLIQVSADGKNWKTVQTIQTKAVGGNSSEALEYDSAIPFSALSLGTGLLLLLAIGDRCRCAFIMAVVVLCALLYSCSRKDVFKNIDNGKLFVRIVQVDKDGTERVSKVIQAVRE